ncbi:MAG: hypothetical protein P4L16_02320 [Chlamydiales bacterium]|nr:hypothetical protein [Chlamydiales bacterium]
MKKFQIYGLLSIASVLLLSSCISDEKSEKEPVNPAADNSIAEEKALRNTTKGDQTDIYAIPFDEDQLGQQEELDKFEQESKEYKAKEEAQKNK